MKKCLVISGVLVIFGFFLNLAVFAQGYELYISGDRKAPAKETRSSEEDQDKVVTMDAASAVHAEIAAVLGTVQVCMAGESECAQAQEGLYLEAGDKVITSSNASLELVFDEAEENIVRIEEKTTIILVLGDDEKLELVEGKVFAAIDNLPYGLNFEIRTPTAVSGVRGTDWVVNVREGVTDIEAISGEPYVKGFNQDGSFRSESLVVRAGYATTVKRFMPPQALRSIPTRKIKAWKDQKQVMKNNIQKTRLERKKMPPLERRIKIKQELKKRIDDKNNFDNKAGRIFKDKNDIRTKAVKPESAHENKPVKNAVPPLKRMLPPIKR